MKVSRRSSITIFLFPLVILVANLALCRSLFQPGYTRHFSSIEPVYFAEAKFFAAQFPSLSWVKEWYLGFPLRYLPNPLFVSVLALANSLLSTLNISFIYRIICGLAYVLVPVVFYFFVYAISHKRSHAQRGDNPAQRGDNPAQRGLVASIAAFSFILLPSVTYILPGIRGLGGGFSYPPFTFLSLVYFGSGPRVVGLMLEFLGLVLILRILPFDSLRSLKVSLRSRVFGYQYWLFVAGAVVAALVFLTDPVAATSFLILSVVLLLSEILITPANLKARHPSTSLRVCDRAGGRVATELRFAKLERFFWMFAAAFGLSAFWFNPSYLWHLFFSPSLGGAPFKNIFITLFNIAIVAIPLYLGFFATKFGRKKENQIWVILSLWLGIFGFLFGIYYLENPEFISEYVKFIPEIDLGICFLIGLVGERVASRILKSSRSFSVAPGALRVIGVIGVMGLGLARGEQLHDWLSPGHSLAGRLEYEIAKWLDENVGDDERVYVTGSTTFWLNALSDVAQMRGGSDMGAIHPWWAHASFQIREGADAELAVDWLRALGVSYIVVHDDSSEEFYHDYKFPEKFGSLEKIYDNDKGDRVYKVDRESLVVRVVDVSDAERLKVPKDGADSKAVGDYAKWRIGGSPASFEWLSNSEAVVRADLDEDQALSLAISYDPGWRADMHGKKIALSKDPIGNIFINSASSDPGSEKIYDPGSSSISEVGSAEVEIKLSYHNPLGSKLGYPITFVTLIVLITFPKFGGFFKKLKPRFFDFEFKDEQEEY